MIIDYYSLYLRPLWKEFKFWPPEKNTADIHLYPQSILIQFYHDVGHKAKISEGFTDPEHFRVWRQEVKCLFSSIVLVYKWGNWGEKRLQLSKCQLQTELELVPGTAVLSTRAGAHLSMTFLWENILIDWALGLMFLKGLCDSYAILVWYAFTASVGLCIW